VLRVYPTRPAARLQQAAENPIVMGNGNRKWETLGSAMTFSSVRQSPTNSHEKTIAETTTDRRFDFRQSCRIEIDILVLKIWSVRPLKLRENASFGTPIDAD
jgi:hypothetical protein